MDLFMAAKYFDSVTFESYDFTNNNWRAGDFIGQLKKSDDFKTIYHRPTRKHMMFTAPDVVPASSVVRVQTTGEIYMMGAHQNDVFIDTHYRNTWALQKPLGQSNLIRMTPDLVAPNFGWVAPVTVRNEFADIEIRSVNDREEDSLVAFGKYIGTFPYDSPIAQGDTITIDGESYWAVEVYKDSGMLQARMTRRPSFWANVVYKQFTGNAYSGGQNVPQYTSHNVTVAFGSTDDKQLETDINASKAKVRILTTWISIVPQLNDVIEFNSKTYKLSKVSLDLLSSQWVLEVNL